MTKATAKTAQQMTIEQIKQQRDDILALREITGLNFPDAIALIRRAGGIDQALTHFIAEQYV